MVTKGKLGRLRGIALLGASVVTCNRAGAQEAPEQNWAIHGQTTFVLQAHPGFASPYQGPNSLAHRSEAKETFDATVYAGLRPWRGGELWVNPEIDQGFGLSDTLGVAGFPSGEAYKVGKTYPYPKLQRWFLRQTIGLGGDGEKVEADLNQLAGHQSADRLVLTVGKFGVVDVFDTNDQAHDPRGDFLNWAIIDAGTFDYAANAWGYTYGAASELYERQWTLRAGLFALSDVPNSENLDSSFEQNEFVGEIEHRHSINGNAGKLKVTLFRNRGRMGRFEDAILVRRTGAPPDVAAVRRMQSRTGASFNFEQQLSKSVSVFVKAGIADGSIEPYEFADIDRTIVGGVTAHGSSWGRPDDKLGIAVVNNFIASVHKRYLEAGGLGILVGDGQLPHPGPEQMAEGYYDLPLSKALRLAFDYQLINHPAYNRDRGPVSAGAIRLHAHF